MERVRAAGVYFLIVFGAGFVLGTIRVLVVEPSLGTRAAELLEVPVMIAIVALTARFVRLRYAGSIRGSHAWLQVGLVALGCMLAADVAVGVALRGMTVWDALFARDPLSGTAYYLALGFLALAPWLFARTGQRRESTLQP